MPDMVAVSYDAIVHASRHFDAELPRKRKAENESSFDTSPALSKPRLLMAKTESEDAIIDCIRTDQIELRLQPGHVKADVLARFWRLRSSNATRQIATRLLDCGPTIAKCRSMRFEDLVVLLREQSVIAKAKACLGRIVQRSSFVDKTRTNCESQAVNVRVFLAVYMIAMFPSNVFEDIGERENTLKCRATELLENFEKLCLSATAEDNTAFAKCARALAKPFSEVLFLYLDAFKAWKIPDEAKLTVRIKHALVALYQANGHLPMEESDDSRLRQEFNTQIDRLRSKLRQIAGADALAKFDAEHAATIAGPFSTPSHHHLPNHPSHAHQVAASSPPRTTLLPDRINNEQLAHELMIDGAFQLDHHGTVPAAAAAAGRDSMRHIRDSFHRAFWESLAGDLQLSPPCYARVLRVLIELRDGVAELAAAAALTPGSAGGAGAAAARVAEAVDVDFIREQARRGVYDWASCCRLMDTLVTSLAHVQSSDRAAETRELWATRRAAMEAAAADAAAAERPAALCGALEFALDRVNAGRIDAANARLRAIAPTVRLHGAEYERGKFAEKLRAGAVTTDRAAAWIRRAVVARAAADPSLLPVIVAGAEAAYVSVHIAGIMDLVAAGAADGAARPAAAAVTAQTCPETLQLDVHRLAAAAVEFGAGVRAAAALSCAVGALHSDAATAQAVAEALATRIDFDSCAGAGGGGVEIATVDELADAAARVVRERTGRADTAAAVRRAVQRCAAPGDAVLVLMCRRMRALWEHVIRVGPPRDAAAAAAAAAAGGKMLCAPAAVLVPAMVRAAGRLHRAAEVNRMVHGELYDGLVRGEAERLVRVAASAKVEGGDKLETR